MFKYISSLSSILSFPASQFILHTTFSIGPHPSSHQIKMNSKPDFVIIGGGLAGLVVANRLTENPKTNVVVLEAGQDHSSDPRIRTPALWPSLLGQDDFDWDYRSTPQVRDNKI